MGLRPRLLTGAATRLGARLGVSSVGGRFGVFLSQRLYCVQSRHVVPAGNWALALGYFVSDMAKSTNPVLRAAIMEIVHKQLRDSTPPAVRATLDRLLGEGHTRQQAEELIACVVSCEIFDILKQGQPYNESRYVDALERLPQLPWDEA